MSKKKKPGKRSSKKSRAKVKKPRKEKRKTFDMILMLGMFVMFIIIVGAIFLFSRSISICGDGRCSDNECDSCSKDCGFRNCADGTCQTSIGENCENTEDCACSAGRQCDTLSEQADEKGCFVSISNILINVRDMVEGVSVSALYNNPMLNDGLNNHVLMDIIVQNIGEGNVSNSILHLKINDYVSDVIVLGRIEKGKLKVFEWNPRFNENVLKVINDGELDVNIKLSYSDEAGQEHTVIENIQLSVLGKNKIGKYGSYKDFVTPDNNAVKEITKGLVVKEYNTKNDIIIAATNAWNNMQELGIDVSSKRIGHVQYPEETINSKKGDSEDIAVLYASILKNMNIKPAIIKTSDKVFVGFYDQFGYIYPVDTTLVSGTFHYAWTIGYQHYSEYTRARDIEVINV